MTRLTTSSTCSGQGRDVGVVDDSARDLSLRLFPRRFPWLRQGSSALEASEVSAFCASSVFLSSGLRKTIV